MGKTRLTKLLAIAAIAVFVAANLAISTSAYGQRYAQTSWASTIDEMLAENEYVEGEVIAVFDSNMPKTSLAVGEAGENVQDLAKVSSDAMEDTFGINMGASETAASIRLIAQEGKTTRQLLEELASDPAVIWAEPNYIKQTIEMESADGIALDGAGKSVSSPEELSSTPQEPSPDSSMLLGAGAGAVSAVVPTGKPTDLIDAQGYSSIGDLSYLQWAYGEGATNRYSIASPNWNETGGRNVDGTPVVAVVDSGIDYTHPDFNGLIVDMTAYSSKGGRYGYNCSGDGPENDPMDDNGHGSHCAGIIASNWDGIGTSGVASGVKLCIVRTSKGGGYTEANIVRAFLYLTEAVDNGLNLLSVNCSFGGSGFTNTELLMVNELGKRGVVTCVASGTARSTTTNHQLQLQISPRAPIRLLSILPTRITFPQTFPTLGRPQPTCSRPETPSLLR